VHRKRAKGAGLKDKFAEATVIRSKTIAVYMGALAFFFRAAMQAFVLVFMKKQTMRSTQYRAKQ
jgi:hypothetical protein